MRRETNNQEKVSKNKSIKYLLEHGSLASLKKAKQKTDSYECYEWRVNAELNVQREQNKDQIKKTLLESCHSEYYFSGWQRAVKYKYSLHPLSTIGSKRWIGGRFNNGSEINSTIKPFSALYIAQDKNTALQEHLGQEKKMLEKGMRPIDIALSNKSSETIISTSGYLEKVFDLTNPKNIIPFLEIIRKFNLSRDTKKQTEKFTGQIERVIRTPQQLIETLLEPNWRITPNVLSTPSTSQIFGDLVCSADIEGILYPSKLTKKPCLAIFPQNFPQTNSFIQIDDETPDTRVLKKIDGSNWYLCELNFEDAIMRHQNTKKIKQNHRIFETIEID